MATVPLSIMEGKGKLYYLDQVNAHPNLITLEAHLAFTP